MIGSNLVELFWRYSVATPRKSGGCHCGDVQFTFQPPRELIRCNCSICHMVGYLHLIVPESEFTLSTDAKALGSYRFNTGEANHLFCMRCGVKSFYYPRSHPGHVSINARCVDGTQLRKLPIVEFDGRNWESEIDDLRERTR